VDGGETDVPAACAAAPLVFEMVQEGSKKGSVEVGEHDLRGRLPQFLPGISQQQAETIPVAGQGVRAGLALPDESIREECLQENGEGPDGAHGRESGWDCSTRKSA
jgi:hypothetical protein